MNNLALNKPAAASSFVSPFSAQKAVDGNVTPLKRWLCDSMPCWLAVDLGAPFWINRWIVTQMGAAGWTSPGYNMKNYSFEGSMDNVSWVTLDTVSNNSLSSTDRTFIPAQARFVRVYVTSGLNVNSGVASIVELQVIEAPPTSSLLSNLSISSGTLAPPFNKQTYSYTSSVGYDTSQITVTPTAEDSHASITVNGTAVTSGLASPPIDLNVGQNTITVQVTSAVGSVITDYTIAVTRASSPYLTSLNIKSGKSTLYPNPQFSKDTFSYSVDASNHSSITMTPTAEDSSAAITVNGTSVPSGQSSPSINLNVGSNTITVKVLSAIGSDQKIYTFNATRTS